MLVAFTDQAAGTSTSGCSKMTSPLSEVMLAVRRSQAISS